MWSWFIHGTDSEAPKIHLSTTQLLVSSRQQEQLCYDSGLFFLFGQTYPKIQSWNLVWTDLFEMSNTVSTQWMWNWNIQLVVRAMNSKSQKNQWTSKVLHYNTQLRWDLTTVAIGFSAIRYPFDPPQWSLENLLLSVQVKLFRLARHPSTLIFSFFNSPDGWGMWVNQIGHSKTRSNFGTEGVTQHSGLTYNHYCKSKTLKFFHNSCLSRWCQQNLQKIGDLTKDWDQITCLAATHSNHYTRMYTVLMWGCNWILLVILSNLSNSPN